tara:strand:+ start:1105 stop:3117 length:2013 start_codon:yes stop_codon:yes gene_type:complete
MKMVNVMRLLLVSLFFQIFSANAQQWCGFQEVNKFHTHSEVPLQPTKRNSLNIPKIIPTIIHILHEGEPYGVFPHLSSEIAYQAIDSVNTWFDETDASLELCIASVGPNGEAMSGIVYHNMLTEFPGYEFSNNAQDYYNYVQGQTIIAPTEYLNIYVDNWTSGPLGFATLPAGPTCWVRTNKFNNAESKTLIHEVGHWCGLYHTFDDNGFPYDDCEDAATETNCETQGDRVCDTPPTTQVFSCQPACPGDVINSYMSYAPDQCRTLFTPGQIDRMHAQLETLRPGVINNNVACGNADVDLAVINFTNNNPECDTYLDPSITVKNFGLDGSFYIECQIQVLDSEFEEVYYDSYIGVITLDQDETLEIAFDPYTFQFGDYTVLVDLVTDGDGWEFNNSLTQDLPLQPFTEINVVYYDGFSPSTQFRIYEWNPETGNHIPGVITSCNWGGPQCWESGFFMADDWPIEWSYCLQPGCYELWWRWTGNSNLDCELVDLLGYPGCYVDIQLSNGEQIYYWDEQIEESQLLKFQFCVEAPDPCPITDCPTDLNGDGVTSNSDLLLFLPYVGQQSECHPTDFNFDGETDINDVFLLLDQFGYSCDGILIEDNFITNVIEDEIIDVYGLCKVGPPIYFDLTGRKVNDKGDLAPGIYIVVQKWSNGNITTQKIFLNSWSQ